MMTWRMGSQFAEVIEEMTGLTVQAHPGRTDTYRLVDHDGTVVREVKDIMLSFSKGPPTQDDIRKLFHSGLAAYLGFADLLRGEPPARKPWVPCEATAAFRKMLSEEPELAVAWDRDIASLGIETEFTPQLYRDGDDTELRFAGTPYVFRLEQVDGMPSWVQIQDDEPQTFAEFVKRKQAELQGEAK